MADHGGLAAGRDAHHNAVGEASKVIDLSSSTNSVVVEAGGTYIQHAPPHELKEWEDARQESWVPQSRAALLHPMRRVVRLMGRETDLAQLVDWCETRDSQHPADVRFRLITGPGGVGKSRLAEELKHALAAQTTTDEAAWVSTTLLQGEAVAAHCISRQRALHPHRPLLCVVDYAEARPALQRLLEDAYRTTGKVRVLLLARTAGRWWHELERLPGDIGYLLRAGYSNADLPNPATSTQELFDAAVEDFARELKVPAPTHGTQVGSPGHGARALDVAVRALVSVLRGAQQKARQDDIGRVPISDVFEELLRHEDRYWAEKARHVGLTLQLAPQMRAMLVAAAALWGTPAKDQALMVASRASKALEDQAEIVPPEEEAAARWLRAVYPPPPGENTWAAALQPDRLAEHLIVSLLSQGAPSASEQAQAALLDDLAMPAATHAATVLVRAVTDPARDDEEATRARRLADRLVTGLQDDWDLYKAVYAVLPHPNTRLDPTGILLTQRQLDHASHHQLDPAERAFAHFSHGAYLGASGRSEKGLEHTQEAVRLWRPVHHRDPEIRSYFADALYNVGVTLSGLGRWEQALGPQREAVDQYRKLRKQDPRFRFMYASALYNLGIYLEKLGKPEKALGLRQEAVQQSRILHDQDPEQYRSLLALTLISLGVSLSAVDRHEEAAKHEREAVALWEVLYEQDPHQQHGYHLRLARNNLEASIAMAKTRRSSGAE
ncbi:tetratricopeptide repeat protein [Streptomyces albidoflavus]|uniref:tetratricopeptide repeat protein n=1 Tax=Streptomyces albidoflavus TaxID=1886 RepID=UPI0020BDB152|nr:tetratricopeptide repeat protein [Streptomyces albidoflavus]MCL6281064.1 tetratricopeptide repeat protein [Streptomyces albidoflavus]